MLIKYKKNRPVKGIIATTFALLPVPDDVYFLSDSYIVPVELPGDFLVTYFSHLFLTPLLTPFFYGPTTVPSP